MPPDGETTGHDRSWLAEARDRMDAGDMQAARRAAGAYWAGERLAGEWEFLAPYARVVGPLPAAARAAAPGR